MTLQGAGTQPERASVLGLHISPGSVNVYDVGYKIDSLRRFFTLGELGFVNQ
jgi:hypothetical protein